jgi:hypothetical protein
MNWEKYLKEKDCFKRYEMLMKENRPSYDHTDNWLISLFNFLKNKIENADVVVKVEKSEIENLKKYIGHHMISKEDLLKEL